uniref:Uncharacterized protein n=1 Tax=Oryza glumipatula TaxID=40148 RepID=A0A0E0BQB5_9ORYZ
MGDGLRRGFRAIAAATMHIRLLLINLQRNLDDGECVVRKDPSIGCDGWWPPPASSGVTDI